MIYKTIKDICINHYTGSILSVLADTELDGEQLMPESVQFHLDLGNLEEVKAEEVKAKPATATPVVSTEEKLKANK